MVGAFGGPRTPWNGRWVLVQPLEARSRCCASDAGSGAGVHRVCACPRRLAVSVAPLLVLDTGDAEDVLQVALMRLTRHREKGLDNPDGYVRA